MDAWAKSGRSRTEKCFKIYGWPGQEYKFLRYLEPTRPKSQGYQSSQIQLTSSLTGNHFTDSWITTGKYLKYRTGLWPDLDRFKLIAISNRFEPTVITGDPNLIELYLGVPFCKTSFSCAILYQNEPNHSLKLTVTSPKRHFRPKIKQNRNI